MSSAVGELWLNGSLCKYSWRTIVSHEVKPLQLDVINQWHRTLSCGIKRYSVPATV